MSRYTPKLMSQTAPPLEIDAKDVSDRLNSANTAVSNSLPETCDPLVLIDCREEDEFAICKISGANLFPLSDFASGSVEAFLKETGPSTTPVVYCHHGMRSAKAAGFLRAKGFSKTRSLAGGIDLWSQIIDPTVTRY